MSDLNDTPEIPHAAMRDLAQAAHDLGEALRKAGWAVSQLGWPTAPSLATGKKRHYLRREARRRARDAVRAAS